ncbi:helix-turn-helix transcriptional regulator [Nocardioides coralli]|uniref:helix-turn-helix transcriptional regulator n=1 Tax=Nocardioides coralli TaxID=2872154 RepID=UPI001CA46A99|nr:helix-turn-helix domain-containing protein [Nocardioides coralli]QZY30357.1 helix-turn-helix domain-containing protein [Nocardioides coralli]
MTDETFARRVTKLGALADPVRRALYHFVADQPGAVSRDQAADGIDVPHHTAKHHLDRLVDEGLLVTEFRRLTGRSGPGAGRPAKLYRRSGKEVSVSLPHRRYDLAGDVLADAVERSLGGTPMADAVQDAATAAGGRAVSASGVDGAGDDLERVAAVLAPFGYEPLVGEELTLRNCPFGQLASDHADLVCGMNQTFVGAVVDALGCTDVAATPDREQSRCCVRVRVDGDGP